MATQKRALASPTSPSPFRMRTQSPALSAVRSSPLSSGSLASYPVTASPFGSSPFESSLELSSIDGGPHSPDLFEPLEYTPDLGADFQRMDREAAAITDEHMGTPPSSATQVLVPDTPPPTLLQDQKTWVVFIGKVPGVYDSFLSAIVQVQGFSGSFQRIYPDRASAITAWEAYKRDKVFPGYGKAPWVVFFGRKLGVFERVTELECSVKAYDGAIFRSCSSLTDAHTRFQLFAKRVANMFVEVDSDSSSNSESPANPPAGQEILQQPRTVPTSTVPDRVSDHVPDHVSDHIPDRPAPAPETAKILPSVVLDGKDIQLALSLSMLRRIENAGTGQSKGWYVVFHAALPGVCCGPKELAARGPKPGGFECAPNEAAANQLFLYLATKGMIVWVDVDEEK